MVNFDNFIKHMREVVYPKEMQEQIEKHNREDKNDKAKEEIKKQKENK